MKIRISVIGATLVLFLGIGALFSEADKGSSHTNLISKQSKHIDSGQTEGKAWSSALGFILGQKAYAYTILSCDRVCTDPEGCECQCNGQDYQLTQGYACE